MRTTFTGAARRDLAGIIRYSRDTWGVEQSAAYLGDINARLAQLAGSPALGRARDDLAPSLRAFPTQSHVIYYLVVEGGISIVRILHERQDPTRYLPQIGA